MARRRSKGEVENDPLGRRRGWDQVNQGEMFVGEVNGEYH